MILILKYNEFLETFGYEYKELKIKLETTKDGDSGHKLILIKNLDDLQKITQAVKNKSYEEGYSGAEYYYTIECSPAYV